MVELVELSNVKITVLRRFHPSEVFDKSPVTSHAREACTLLKDGQEFIVENLEMPKGFCSSAWVSMYGTIQILSFGGDLPWIKEKGVAISCCLDGLRPVIFRLERV